MSLGRNQDLLEPAAGDAAELDGAGAARHRAELDPARFVGSFESIAFIGVVGAVLAVIGITDAVMKPQRRPWAISFVVIGGLAVVWAMGPRTFVFDTAFDVLPGFDLARASARWLVVVTIVASLFVGVGVDVLTRRVRPVHLVAVVVAILAVAGALAIGLVDAAAPDDGVVGADGGRRGRPGRGDHGRDTSHPLGRPRRSAQSSPSARSR